MLKKKVMGTDIGRLDKHLYAESYWSDWFEQTQDHFLCGNAKHSLPVFLQTFFTIQSSKR